MNESDTKTYYSVFPHIVPLLDGYQKILQNNMLFRGIKDDVKLWLNKTFHKDWTSTVAFYELDPTNVMDPKRVLCNVVMFRKADQAMLFKLTWYDL